MHKLYLLLIFILIFSSVVKAQRRAVYGILRDSITHYPIANGTVNNSTTNKRTNTSANGIFRIEIAPNDFLFIAAVSYNYYTLTYTYLSTDTIAVYLSPAGNVLPEVKVTSRYNKYQLDSIKRKTLFEENRGIKMQAVSSHSPGFGLTINLDKFFKTKYKNQKDSERTMLRIERDAYINYRFPPHLIAYYTGLKGDVLQNFINKYIPGYLWLRQHPNNEDVMYYINDKLKEMRQERGS